MLPGRMLRPGRRRQPWIGLVPSAAAAAPVSRPLAALVVGLALTLPAGARSGRAQISAPPRTAAAAPGVARPRSPLVVGGAGPLRPRGLAKQVRTGVSAPLPPPAGAAVRLVQRAAGEARRGGVVVVGRPRQPLSTRPIRLLVIRRDERGNAGRVLRVVPPRVRVVFAPPSLRRPLVVTRAWTPYQEGRVVTARRGARETPQAPQFVRYRATIFETKQYRATVFG